MDTKRLLLVVALSMFIFIGWQWLALQMGWVVPPSETTPTAQTTPASPTAAAVDALVPVVNGAFEAAKGKSIRVETPLYFAVFNTQGGVLQEFALKKYKATVFTDEPVQLVTPAVAAKTPMALMLAGMNTASQAEWAFAGDDINLNAGESGSLLFTATIDGMQVAREYVFSAESYGVKENLTIGSDKQRALNLAFVMAAETLAADTPPSILDNLKYMFFGGEKPETGVSAYNQTRIAWLQDTSFKEETSQSDLSKGERVIGNVSWGAVLNNYFVCAVSMPADKNTVLYNKFDNNIYQTSLGKTDEMVEAGSSSSFEINYFLGPKSSESLAVVPNNINKALDYGFFTLIAAPLVVFLKFLNSYVGNYGIAIILMTIAIKILFWPLSQKSYKSMEEMKRIQPEVARIRERYADDKETMNKEIMQLYRTHKVNPAGGCLPIALQIPVFFGLYQGLLNSIELRHTAFIETLPFTDMPWLVDLSAHDPYLITPLLMGASMFLQQKMAPPMGDPTQAKIMLFMPIVFTFIFLGFPAGLVIYWLVNNIISILQQWLQRRSLQKKEPVVA